MIPIVILAFLELGGMDGGIANYEPPTVFVMSEPTFYVDIGMEAALYGFYAKGNVRTMMQKDTLGIEFWPVAAWYSFGAGWRNDWLDCGWRHHCDHPIVAYPYYMGLIKWDAGWDEIFARVTLRMSQ